jgi:hypothetical protein
MTVGHTEKIPVIPSNNLTVGHNGKIPIIHNYNPTVGHNGKIQSYAIILLTQGKYQINLREWKYHSIKHVPSSSIVQDA